MYIRVKKGVIDMKKNKIKYCEKLMSYSKIHYEKAMDIAENDFFKAVKEIFLALECQFKVKELILKENTIFFSLRQITEFACLEQGTNEERIRNAYLHFSLF